MILIENEAQERAILRNADLRSDHHAPMVSEAIRLLFVGLFSVKREKMYVSSRGGKICSSIWVKFRSGNWRYFCYDHKSESIVMKEKKGGTILATFNNQSSPFEIASLLRQQ